MAQPVGGNRASPRFVIVSVARKVSPSKWFATTAHRMPRWAPRGNERWLMVFSTSPGPRDSSSGVDVLHDRNSLEKAPLQKEEENDDRQRGEHRRRHEKVPRRAPHLPLKRLKPERQRERALIREVEERAQEVVPRVDELEEGDDRERRSGERNVDLQEDAKLRCAVEHHGFAQGLGDARKKLAQEKDVEGSAEKRREPQRLQGTDPAERFENAVERHHEHRKGNHHRSEREPEEHLLAGPFEAGEAVGEQGGPTHGSHRRPEHGQRPAET